MGRCIPAETLAVQCVICKYGETRRGKATVALTREETTVVIKGVPADVCTNCGEEYVDETTAARLLKAADDAVRAGIELAVREYAAG